MERKKAVAMFLVVLCVGATGTMVLGNSGTNPSSKSTAPNEVTVQTVQPNDTKSAPAKQRKTASQKADEAWQALQRVSSAQITVDSQAEYRGKSTKATFRIGYQQKDDTRITVRSSGMKKSDMVVLDEGTTYYDSSSKTAYTASQTASNTDQLQQVAVAAGIPVQSLLAQSRITRSGTATVNGKQTYVLCIQVGELRAFKGTPLEGTSTTVKLYLSEQSDLPLKVVTTTTKDGQTVLTTESVITYKFVKNCPTNLPSLNEQPEVADTKQMSMNEVHRFLFRAAFTKQRL